MSAPATDRTPGQDRRLNRRPDRFEDALDRLTPIERLNVRFVRASFQHRAVNDLLRTCQRYIGAGWIRACTSRLIHIHGLDRLPPPGTPGGVIWASNHRSFFDMYVANAYLFRAGYHERVLYPVRSNFFYDSVPGLLVNGIMSFWSMYPPVFRDRKRLSLNHTSFAELARAAQQGRSVGIHPEGTRNPGADPLSLLPAQSGVGRLMHLARVPVIPFFINGLGNDLRRQVRGNFDGRGKPIVLVFGEPLQLDDLLAQPGSGRVYRDLSERVMAAILELGQEEASIRKALPSLTQDS